MSKPFPLRMAGEAMTRKCLCDSCGQIWPAVRVAVIPLTLAPVDEWPQFCRRCLQKALSETEPPPGGDVPPET